jgi:hypothetical protein
MGIKGMHAGFQWEIEKLRGHHGHLDVQCRIILRWILDKENGVVWTGFILLRIGISGGFL